ncbi:hypothetical protein [Arthrobacter sp. MYb214]|uniref:hypothetical protein n=1 Tax=Arthrobacter sp. MYb214 TaxID=1848596 RepID=UPI0011B02FEA|nr:hypothetical protein [Arthrobacter sp. MYb214]
MLARNLLNARENGRDHDALLERLREADLLTVDDFLTVGLDQNIASDVYGVLAVYRRSIWKRLCAHRIASM